MRKKKENDKAEELKQKLNKKGIEKNEKENDNELKRKGEWEKP